MLHRCAAALGALLLCSPVAHAQPTEPELSAEAEARAETTAAESEVARTLVSADRDIPATYRFWESDDGEAFIKPVVAIASSVVGYFPDSDTNPELANRVSTLALARFGLEGELGDHLSFRSVFERNVGFNVARNGPVGTSVWEGTASLSARENYLRLRWRGLELSGGIVRDPASVDYVSDHVLDLFGVDPYVRDPLLYTGFNQGQALLLRYRLGIVTPGLAYTAGNPLVSSLAFGFGGDVSTLGTLFTAPLRAFSNGIPGSDIHMQVVSPSVTVEQGIVDAKVAAQFYFVDVDVTESSDERLTGYNLRGTVQVRPLGDTLRVFASGAYRRNEQLAIPDLMTLKDSFESIAVGGGADLSLARFGAGVTYYWIERRLGGGNDVRDQFLNVGATYWLVPPRVSVGARFALSAGDADSGSVSTTDTMAMFLGLRLLI